MTSGSPVNNVATSPNGLLAELLMCDSWGGIAALPGGDELGDNDDVEESGMKSVYLETTIISYLTARPSRDLVNAARQQVTREWWENRRSAFSLFASDIVVLESTAGDSEAAERRLALLRDVSILEVTEEALTLATALLEHGTLPESASDDAIHLATAAVHGMDYLRTWNCRHLANAELVALFETFFLDNGYEPPYICTPDELLEPTDA